MRIIVSILLLTAFVLPVFAEGDDPTAWLNERKTSLTSETEDIQNQLTDRPEGPVTEILKKMLNVKTQLAAAIDARIMAESSDDAAKQAAEKKMAEMEKQHENLGLDMEEAQTIENLEKTAADSGVKEGVQEIIAEVKATFQRIREIKKQMESLQRENELVFKKLELTHKKMEMLILEKESNSLREEVSEPEKSTE